MTFIFIFYHQSAPEGNRQPLERLSLNLFYLFIIIRLKLLQSVIIKLIRVSNKLIMRLKSIKTAQVNLEIKHKEINWIKDRF